MYAFLETSFRTAERGFVYSECTLNVQVYDLTDDIMLNKVN